MQQEDDDRSKAAKGDFKGTLLKSVLADLKAAPLTYHHRVCHIGGSSDVLCASRSPTAFENGGVRPMETSLYLGVPMPALNSDSPGSGSWQADLGD